MMLFRRAYYATYCFLLTLQCSTALLALKNGLSQKKIFSSLQKGSKYDDWEVDLAIVESRRDNPLVRVEQSSIDGGGLGVFINEDIKKGQTLTEWVGLLSPTPQGAFEELEILQSYYGSEWRGFAQRYEIGLSGTRVVDAVGMALGGAVRLHHDDNEEDILSTADNMCLVDEDRSACAARAGETEYILLGKTYEQGACPREGVAQLINDHSAVFAPPLPDPLLHLATARSAATENKDGSYAPEHIDGFLYYENSVPVAADFDTLHAASMNYIKAIVPNNNVALVQADIGKHEDHNHAPRIFAVATRDLPANSELLFVWFGILACFPTFAALAQLVVCRPKPARANAVADLIRAIEHTSRNLVQAEAAAIKEAASMPSRYVQPLEPLPPLDDLLDPQSWQFALLQEQLSLNTECPLELDPLRIRRQQIK